MSSDHHSQLPQLAEDETKVGNYFVANYPPFSCWLPENVTEAHAALAGRAGPTSPRPDLGLYVHIPFCRKRCHFCYFRVYTDRNAKQIGDYTSAVIREMSLYAEKPALQERDLRFIYFGGGTPSYLSVEQLERLFEGLQAKRSWRGVEEVAFECEPGTLNRRKLEAIRNLGVTRLSLGVENFDDGILELNNRAHLSKQVFSAYDEARAVDFPQINIDLIAGMLGETEDNWHRCVDQTIELAPDSVTVYQMEIPYNTTIYREMMAQRKVAAPVADWATKRRWVGDAFRRLEDAGYTIGSAYTAVKAGQATSFLYRDALWRGADMVGLGVASFSHVSGTHFQNEHDAERYQARLGRDELPIYRAMTMTPTEQLIRQFVLQLKLGRVERQYFQDRFGVDVNEQFHKPLLAFEDAGHLTRDEQTITLNREALLRIDSLLSAFFLPEHRTTRYA